MHRYTLVLVAVLGMTAGGHAQSDKYNATTAERVACTPDAVRLCMAAYPDEDKLIACMKANRAGLSANCRTAFDAGMKSRGLQ